MYVHANIGKTNKRESVRNASLLELRSGSLSCVCLCVFGEGMRGGAMLKLWKPRCMRVFLCVGGSTVVQRGIVGSLCLYIRKQPNCSVRVGSARRFARPAVEDSVKTNKPSLVPSDENQTRSLVIGYRRERRSRGSIPHSVLCRQDSNSV